MSSVEHLHGPRPCALRVLPLSFEEGGREKESNHRDEQHFASRADGLRERERETCARESRETYVKRQQDETTGTCFDGGRTWPDVDRCQTAGM